MTEINTETIEKLFPGLTESMKGLDLADPTSTGHLIIGRLGSLPVEVRSGLDPKKALETVKNFCAITGLAVTYDPENNVLDYPQLHQE